MKDGREEGVIQLEADERSGFTGLVFQNAESHLLCTMVEDEVGFGPQNFGFLMVPPIVRKLTAHRLIGRGI